MTYQFKIQIKGFENPEIWRQIEVPSNYSFSQFHEVITVAFGRKQNKSIFSFSPSGKDSKPQIVPIDIPWGDNITAKTTLLSSIFKYQGKTFVYSPDLYDKWPHHIVLEKITSDEISYAECLAGEGAYPPETCADPEDYEEMKQILSDKNHPQYKSIREWLELDENETWEDKYKFDLSKVNEQLANIDAPLKSFRNYTIVQHDTFDAKYGLNPLLWRIIDKQRKEVHNNKNWNKIFRETQKLVREYPNIPHFKNTLAITYLKTGDKMRFYEILQQLLTEYPDYILARCNLINQYTDAENELGKAAELLGENFDLSELYPNRNGKFTEMEIFNYHIAVFRYLLKTKNVKEAQEHLDYLEYLFPDDINEGNFQMLVNLARLENTRKKMSEKKPMKVIPVEVTPTDKEPNFENSEIKVLYQQGAYIKREILHHIMELPRESVIRDLEKILIDSIARFDYFRENDNIDIPNAPIHALFLLSALEAEEALDTLFTVLRQDEDYYDFWYGDMITEDFWQFIYMLGHNHLDRLKNYFLTPNCYQYARAAVSEAVKQIAFQQQERKEEALKWHEDVLQYMLEHQNDTDVFDSDVYSYCLEDMIDVAGKEHLPIILRLYDENLINEHFTLPEIKRLLTRRTSDYKVRDIYTSIDQYYDLWQSWLNDNSDDDFEDSDEFGDSDKYKPLLPSVAATPKVGRNDPCPCGSGKKYKKCCGAN